MSPLRVVIADDHPFYRKGLARSLRGSGIDVVADVPNGAAAIRTVAARACDVVLMDLNMPGISGTEATRQLKTLAPEIPVLILSVSAAEGDVADAIRAGARGYVLKEGPVEEVILAMREALAGATVLSGRLALTLLSRVGGNARPAT